MKHLGPQSSPYQSETTKMLYASKGAVLSPNKAAGGYGTRLSGNIMDARENANFSTNENPGPSISSAGKKDEY